MSSILEGEKGLTKFYVEFKDEVVDFFAHVKDYFSETKEVLFENEHGQVLAKHNRKPNLYRKGIKCSNEYNNSLYDYNLYDVKIGEDRIVNSTRELMSKVMDVVSDMTDHEMIRSFVGQTYDYNTYEGYRIDEVHNDVALSNNWKDALEGYILVPKMMERIEKEFHDDKVIKCADDMYNMIVHNFREFATGKYIADGSLMYKEVEMTHEQHLVLRNAIAFLATVDIHVDYPYQVVIFNNETILARAFKGVMLFSEEMFNKCSQDEINLVVLEEWVHIKYEVHDRSLAMQNRLFTMWGEMAKKYLNK